jgi:hypothetical protein
MWRHALLCCCTAALGAALAISPFEAKAEQTNFTLYSQSVDGVTDFFGPGAGPPGSTFVQASALYTTSNRTGTPIGTIYLSCIVMLNQLDALCTATMKSANGTDAINIQGYYSEVAELSNNCGPVVQVLGVSGGTGAFKGAQGEVTVTHTPVNPAPPSQGCAHSTHDFMFAVSLKHQPDGGDDSH